jgi:hypothetical protein
MQADERQWQVTVKTVTCTLNTTSSSFVPKTAPSSTSLKASRCIQLMAARSLAIGFYEPIHSSAGRHRLRSDSPAGTPEHPRIIAAPSASSAIALSFDGCGSTGSRDLNCGSRIGLDRRGTAAQIPAGGSKNKFLSGLGDSAFPKCYRPRGVVAPSSSRVPRRRLEREVHTPVRAASRQLGFN